MYTYILSKTVFYFLANVFLLINNVYSKRNKRTSLFRLFGAKVIEVLASSARL